MTINLGAAGLSLASGALLAQEIQVEPLVEKIGPFALTVMVIYWLLNSFSKRLDRLTAAIDKLTDKVDG